MLRPTIDRTEEEYRVREHLISRIEAVTGRLASVPYHLIDTDDLHLLEESLHTVKRLRGVPDMRKDRKLTRHFFILWEGIERKGNAFRHTRYFGSDLFADSYGFPTWN